MQRQLVIPNIEQKSRDDLLKIFHSYAMPLHKRLPTRTNKNTDHQMEITPTEPTYKAGNKHKRITYDSSLTPSGSENSKSMDLVTNGCKRIKIGAISDSTSEYKRGIQDIKVDSSFSQKTKRPKITWP